jgi:hypothetical protein
MKNKKRIFILRKIISSAGLFSLQLIERLFNNVVYYSIINFIELNLIIVFIFIFQMIK